MVKWWLTDCVTSSSDGNHQDSGATLPFNQDGWACIYGLFLESNHLSILFRPSTTVKYNHSIVILQEQTIEWPFEDVNIHWLKREPHIHPCTDWYIKSFNEKKDRPGQKWHSPLLMKILTRSWSPFRRERITHIFTTTIIIEYLETISSSSLLLLN